MYKNDFFLAPGPTLFFASLKQREDGATMKDKERSHLIKPVPRAALPDVLGRPA